MLKLNSLYFRCYFIFTQFFKNWCFKYLEYIKLPFFRLLSPMKNHKLFLTDHHLTTRWQLMTSVNPNTMICGPKCRGKNETGNILHSITWWIVSRNISGFTKTGVLNLSRVPSIIPLSGGNSSEIPIFFGSKFARNLQENFLAIFLDFQKRCSLGISLIADWLRKYFLKEINIRVFLCLNMI